MTAERPERDSVVAGVEGGGRGRKPRNVGSFLKARKPKEIDSSLDQ